MHSIFDIGLVVIAFVASWLGTIGVERLAPQLGLVQPPNERSSHTRPTARGGGIAIAITTLVCGGLLAANGAPQILAILAITASMAALGFVDDLHDLPAALRFPVQIVAFAALLWVIGPLPAIALPFGLLFSGLALGAVLLLVGLWWLNLFNFMDGIDGIAGSQAILLLLGACLIWWSTDPLALASPSFTLALASAAATAGFLIRNWPPARIFMGDAGSNALALVIFAIALSTIAAGAMGYQSWLILPSAFVADATITLLRRIARGERPWHAHRRHAYQQLSRRWSHRRATVLYCGLTLLWAIPMAFAAQHLAGLAWPLVAVAYAPLIAFMIWADAGGADEVPARA